MALIECKDCKNFVSNEAINCPKCGCPIEKSLEKSLEKKLELEKSLAKPLEIKNNIPKKEVNNEEASKGCFIFLIVIIVIIIIVANCDGKSDSEETYEATDEINYDSGDTTNDIVSSDYESSETGSYDQDESGMAAQIAQEYVKARLTHPSTADFQWTSISHKRIDASTYQIMQKFTAKNSYNLEIEYLYKIHLKYKGGISADSNNWEETYFKMEEYGK